MYSAYGGTSSTITNNPFVTDPTNAQNRFPDISSGVNGGSNGMNVGYPNSNSMMGSYSQPQSPGGVSMGGYPGQQQQMYSPTGYGQNQQQQIQMQQQQYPSSSAMMGAGAGMNYGVQSQFSGGYGQPQQQLSGQAFQPSSSFGQQLVGQVNGSLGSYGYLQQQQQATPTGYPMSAQQQIQNNPGYVAQFDPYSAIGQGWGDASSQQQPSQSSFQQNTKNTQQNRSTTGGSLGPKGNQHPRDCIRNSKAELESWDQYSWKQLLGSFEALKEAWESRKNELQGKISGLQQQLQFSGGGYYAQQIQQEGMRLQGLLKDANSYVDSILASIFQMREVFSSYRQSGDMASKRRVRESCNAALTNLPDWPGQY